MGKLKKALILFGAAIAVVLCAFLPRIVSSAGDNATLGKAGSRWMQSMQFEIHKNLPALGKLAMVANATDAVEVPENTASKSAAQIRDAFTEAMNRFIDSGLMAPYAEWQITIQSMLPQGADMASVLWHVIVIGDSEGQYYIEAILDDETGQLLMVDVLDQQYRGSDIRKEQVYTLTDLYFQGLDIEEYPSVPYVNNGDYQRYRFEDTEYGEVFVELQVQAYGFHAGAVWNETPAYEK